MKTQKIVHYQIAVSPKFQSTHPKKGKPTYFVEKIKLALNLLIEAPGDFIIDLDPKLHTCRKNYELWVKRMKKVLEGKAVIDLFYWKLKGGRYTPGNDKIVFATLDKDSGCGVQKVQFFESEEKQMSIGIDEMIMSIRDNNNFHSVLAENDGLSLQDFKDWFKKYDLSKPLAIIHFTKFRY